MKKNSNPYQKIKEYINSEEGTLYVAYATGNRAYIEQFKKANKKSKTEALQVVFPSR